MTSNPLTLWREDSPAKTCRTRVNMLGLPALMASAAVYGPSSTESFAIYDPDSCSWRTCQACLFEGWDESLAIWPRSGTTRNGTAYQRPSSVPTTYEHASGFWPTPSASDHRRKRSTFNNLSAAVGGIPNPDWKEWLMGFPEGWSKTGTALSVTP